MPELPEVERGRRSAASVAEKRTITWVYCAEDAYYPPHWLFHRRWGKRTDAATARGAAVEHMTIGGRTTAWVPAVQS